MDQERQLLEALRFFFKFGVWRDTYLEEYLEGWKCRSSHPVTQSRLLFSCWRVLPAYHSYTKWVNFSILGPILLWMYPYCGLFWYHTSTDSIQGEQNGKKNLPATAYTCTAQVLVVFSVVSLENWYFRHWPGYCIVMWMKMAPDLYHVTACFSVD